MVQKHTEHIKRNDALACDLSGCNIKCVIAHLPPIHSEVCSHIAHIASSLSSGSHMSRWWGEWHTGIVPCVSARIWGHARTEMSKNMLKNNLLVQDRVTQTRWAPIGYIYLLNTFVTVCLCVVQVRWYVLYLNSSIFKYLYFHSATVWIQIL